EVDDRPHHPVAGHRLAQEQRDQQRHHRAECHLGDREVQRVAGGDPEDRIGQGGGVVRQAHEGGRADQVVLVEAEDESERERDEGDQDDAEQPGRGQADTGASLGPLQARAAPRALAHFPAPVIASMSASMSSRICSAPASSRIARSSWVLIAGPISSMSGWGGWVTACSEAARNSSGIPATYSSPSVSVRAGSDPFSRAIRVLLSPLVRCVSSCQAPSGSAVCAEMASLLTQLQVTGMPPEDSARGIPKTIRSSAEASFCSAFCSALMPLNTRPASPVTMGAAPDPE